MRTFVLRAYRANGSYASTTFLAEDDKRALIAGGIVVMGKAYPNVEPWANGKIDLINDMGVVLAEMGAR